MNCSVRHFAGRTCLNECLNNSSQTSKFILKFFSRVVTQTLPFDWSMFSTISLKRISLPVSSIFGWCCWCRCAFDVVGFSVSQSSLHWQKYKLQSTRRSENKYCAIFCTTWFALSAESCKAKKAFLYWYCKASKARLVKHDQMDVVLDNWTLVKIYFGKKTLVKIYFGNILW